MSRFFTLASSSSGNSTCIQKGSCSVLVDVGISARACKCALEAAGTSLSHVKAIFVTHEHTDHIKGLKTLLKNNNIPLYSSEKILSHLCKNDLIPPCAEIHLMEESQIIQDEIKIMPFKTNHDSIESYGFVFDMAGQSKAAILTDNGIMTDEIQCNINGCDVVMIESNYDKGMLECGTYPYYLKRRIQSNTGHMSNQQCAAAVVAAAKINSKKFVLCHLSKENNYPALAREVTLQQLAESGLKENLDFTLAVAPAGNQSEIILF